MNYQLPVIILKDLVLFPQQEVRIDINNSISKNTINLAIKEYDEKILVICPKEVTSDSEDIDVSDLPSVGVVGNIKSKMELPNGTLRVTIKGIKRTSISNYTNINNENKILIADLFDIDIPKYNELEEIVHVRKLKQAINDYIDNNKTVSNSIISTIKRVDGVNLLTDIIATFIPLKVSKKLDYMQEINGLKRANSLLNDLALEMDLIALEERLDDNLREKLEETQKDYILHEKLNELKKELGEVDEKQKEVAKYFEQLENLHVRDKTYDFIASEIKKYEYTNESSPEIMSIRTYLDWVLNLPWNTKSTDETSIIKIKKALDDTHYGLQDIKNRIIEDTAIRKNNALINGPIICLVGPPGVGKTSIAKSIAKALNKKFFKISLGAMSDASELNGHRRTYLGSAPGKIMKALRLSCTNNPVILLDEVDKMGHDYKSDPSSVLLDVLDPEQNNRFTDNYIDMPFSLSDVTFILTANDIKSIPTPLLDRLEIIQLNSYTEFEKIDIIKKYLIPKIFNNYHVTKNMIKFRDDTLNHLIRYYTKESGVREVERLIDTITRKVITENIDDISNLKINITTSSLKKYLGNYRYEYLVTNNYSAGVVNILAYTPYGGVVSVCEATKYPGLGNVTCTGQLGDIINESVSVSISYIKSNMTKLGINNFSFDTTNIHLHFLDGSVKKDGPSAGVNITTSLLSLILNKPISKNIAMTGEISLYGDIYKIGGLKEKLIGAYNAGIKEVFIPYENKHDLEEVPNIIKDNINIILVNNYLEIYNYLFTK